MSLQIQERNERAIAIRANALTTACNQILADAVNAESAVRGYAVTQDPTFLDPYNKAVSSVDTDTAALNRAASSASERSGATAVTATFTRRITQLTQLEGAVAAGRSDRSFLIGSLNDGSSTMTQLRGQVAQLSAAPAHLSVIKRAAINRLERQIETVQVVGLVLGVLAGLAAVALFTSGISRRVRAAAANADRLGRAEEIQPGPPSTDEIGELGRSLQQASDLLDTRLRELAETRDRALDATHAKNTFLSRTSHELRTPLNAILGFAQLLELSELDSDDQDSVEHILAAGRHLLSMINELIDIALIEAGELRLSVEPVVVHAATAEVAELIKPLAAARGITVHFESASPMLTVQADEQRLRQILVNLASNAVKYNHDGGSIRIGYRLSGSEAVAVTVTDSGAGLSPKQIERIFMPFERLDADQSDIEGTGIGLPLALALTEAMQGSLDVTSRVGEGSTFTVVLPRAADVEPVSPPASRGEFARSRAERQLDQAALTVLSIEDNPANNAVLTQFFMRWPQIELLIATAALPGLELAFDRRPDLILLDLHLPDLSGEEAFARLQADPRTLGIPVVVLSADATPGSIRRLMDKGATGYLTKPVDLAELTEVVERTPSRRAAVER